MKKALQGIILVIVALVLVACNKPDKKDDLTLNMAVNFSGKQYISYNQDTPYQALDGKTYTRGDLTPTWAKISENLNVKFNDVAFIQQKGNTDTQFADALKDGFAGIDLINHNGAAITAERDHFVNLKPFIDAGDMPNLKAFLDSQATYTPYLTAADGGIYYTPYLDGNEEVELGFLMRIDWTQKILDTTVAGDATTTYAGLINLTRHNPAKVSQRIKVATSDSTTRLVVKDGDVTNIIDQLKATTPANYLTTFRAYMQEVYGDQGYTNLSDVFVGVDASYDVDELTALMAVVKANPQMLRGENSVDVYFPREQRGSRVRNLFRGLEMYGLRGAVSKNNWLYLDNDGQLVDSRHETEGLDAFDKLNAMYKDGLIMNNFNNSGNNTNHRDNLLKNDNGFLMYDYNATSTATDIINAAKKINPDYRFESILPPVSNWEGNGEYFHFTESVRSLKNEAWGITKQAAKDPAKLAKAVELVDYLYDAEEGADLHLFGPEEWRHATETKTYKGEEIPAFSAGALEEMADPNKGKGNMINYLRDFVGATLPVGHVRSLGVELQTLSDQGERGYNRVRDAIDAGTYRLIGLYEDENGVTSNFYTPVPNVFAISPAQESELKVSKKAFDEYWGDNQLHIIVTEGIGDRALYMQKFQYETTDWYVKYIQYYQTALDKILK